MKLGNLFVLCATAVLAGFLGYQLRGGNPNRVVSSENPTPIPTPTPTPTSSSTPHSVKRIQNGNCNAQNSGNSAAIMIVCKIGFGSFPGNPFFPDNTVSEFRLKATIDNLNSGSDRFTLKVLNESLDYIAHFSTREIKLVDSLGNTYYPNRWAMHGEEFTKEIPPDTSIKMNYTLNRPIDSNATFVKFTVNDLWAQPLSSGFRSSMPPVHWTSNL